MAKRGDVFIVPLGNTHLDWGRHRYTNTRDPIPDEGYLPIPAHIARQFDIMNSNATNGQDVLGSNIFNCQSVDGHLQGVLKAQGSSFGGAVHAKNFSIKGNLKLIGRWLKHMNAHAGNSVKVTWLTPTDVILELI